MSSKFILLTQSDGREIVLNTDAIEVVREWARGGTLVVFRGGTAAGDPRDLNVQEDYVTVRTRIFGD